MSADQAEMKRTRRSQTAATTDSFTAPLSRVGEREVEALLSLHGSPEHGGPIQKFYSCCRAAASIAFLWLFLCSSAVAEKGFIPLLKGESLDTWIYVGEGPNGYSVQDGILICPAEEKGNLFTRTEYSDFVLGFEFRLEEGGNNGVAIRSPLRKDAHLTGMEIQILDDQAPRYKDIVQPVQYHGSIYGVVPAKRGFLKKAGEWNLQEIRAEGRHIRVTLNGTVIVDADLGAVTDPEILSEHLGLQRSQGHIGFLGHSSRVEFRNMRIKELP